MKINKGPETIKEIMKTRQSKRPPAYPWQDLALRIITELSIPKFKRNSVFKVSKQRPKEFIEKCLNDTKELCQTGQCWKYFFKLVNKK